jgi:L-amino acid N-acyltransferase YncA
MTPSNWPAVQAIYTAGIATGHATFEDQPPTWEASDRTRVADPRLVAVDSEREVCRSRREREWGCCLAPARAP